MKVQCLNRFENLMASIIIKVMVGLKTYDG